MYRFITLIFLTVFIPTYSYADNNTTIKNLWTQYAQEKDKGRQLNILLQLGECYYLGNDGEKRDSVWNAAADMAQMADNDTLEARVYEQYFHAFSDDEHPVLATAKVFVQHLLAMTQRKNDNILAYRAYSAMAGINLYEGKAQQALANANKAFHYVSILDNEALKAECYLLMGKCLEQSNEKIEAFRQYSNALYIAQKTEDTSITFSAYQYLSNFYRDIRDMDKSLFYNRKQFVLLNSAKAIDSVRLMTLYNYLAQIFYYNNKGKKGERITIQVIRYAMDKGYFRMKNNALIIYRTYLLNNGLLNELYDFYVKQYPEELTATARQDPALYLKINAYIQEVKGHLDSAMIYNRMAEESLLKQNKNKIYLANFYKRYGEFFLRHNMLDSAKNRFVQSFEYAKAARYFPYVVATSNYLDSINYLQHNYQDAYYFTRLNKLYLDSEATSMKEDDLLRVEIGNEEKQRELFQQKEHEREARQRSIQYLSIIILIVTMFVILVMLGSFKVPKIVIESLGFFSFLLFFEFIVMITDARVEAATHGEPYKILAFKIMIMAILVPLHHWLEHNVVKYLHEHKLIDTSKLSLKHIFRKRVQKAVVLIKPDKDSSEPGKGEAH